MIKNKKLIVKSLIAVLAVGYIAFNFTDLKNGVINGFKAGYESIETK